MFAAFANKNKPESQENPTIDNNQEWLNLSSFEPAASSEQVNAPKRYKSKIKKKKHKKHKSDHHEHEEPVIQSNNESSDDFTIDKSRIIEYLTVERISKPAAPRYHIDRFLDHSYYKRKLHAKRKRYYQIKTTKDEDDDGKSGDATKPNSNEIEEEAEITRQTGEFNRKLTDDPHDVNLWIEYSNYQDTIYQFEKSYRKGSHAKGQRVTAERKLSILDRAISHNPSCERLLRQRLTVAVSVYPADELQAQLAKLVDKDQGNIILWQGYIEATQCSMSHCSAPNVISLYIKCLNTLHTLRRTAKLDKEKLEENILRMLYQCGLFLKQAGLFEQLWTLLRLYLELNLSNSLTFTTSAASEQQLVELEEVVLNSKLPIHELWLRIEKLRECCHYLPCNEAAENQDPQRIVFAEDVSELIHPITMPGNTFKLIVTILTLLKIPLIPCRHSSMTEFGIDYVPWAVDAIETLLPIYLLDYPLGDINHKLLSTITQRLAVGPQYLKTLPGQEEYLEFVLTIMKSCIDSLTNYHEKTALIIWWMRFQRLLTALENATLLKLPTSFKKKLKSEVKAILKDNSHNVILFKECALIEYESGRIDIAINMLKTAINSCLTSRGTLLDISDQFERASICSTFRTLIELCIKSNPTDCKLQVLKYFAAFFNNGNVDEQPRFLTQGVLGELSDKITNITSQILSTSDACIIENSYEHFLPNFAADWMCCHAWFVHFHVSFDAARILLDNALGKFTASRWHREVLHEFYVALMFKVCNEQPASQWFGKFDALLLEAIETYPNNLFLLATISRVQAIYFNYAGPIWWRIKTVLMRSGHALSTLFLLLIANQQIVDVEEKCKDTITGCDLILSNNFKNRMLSLFKGVTTNEMCTRRCGLVWRLYLQFLHAYFDPKQCRNAYYNAVEECPWLKALYIDAAVYIPEELPQIQDLIIEKQLRIHVTPEELEVLRN